MIIQLHSGYNVSSLRETYNSETKPTHIALSSILNSIEGISHHRDKSYSVLTIKNTEDTILKSVGLIQIPNHHHIIIYNMVFSSNTISVRQNIIHQLLARINTTFPLVNVVSIQSGEIDITDTTWNTLEYENATNTYSKPTILI